MTTVYVLVMMLATTHHLSGTLPGYMALPGVYPIEKTCKTAGDEAVAARKAHNPNSAAPTYQCVPAQLAPIVK